ncbi:MAG: glutaredoxin family protein [Terriglobales bacterium]
MSSGITVYGVDSCEDTQGTLAHLRELGVDFRYVKLDEDAEADRLVKEWNSGKRITPTVVVSSLGYQRHLMEPENSDLDMELDRAHLLPQNWEGDRKRQHQPRNKGPREAA